MSGEAIEIAKSAGELKELSDLLPLAGVLLAAFFGIREWKASALEKNWEFATELEREWNGSELREARAAVARYCILLASEGNTVDLNNVLIEKHAEAILDFFENVGYLVKKGMIKTEFAWLLFHEMIKMYQPHLNSVVEGWRNSGEVYDGSYYDQYEFLYKTLDKEQFKQTEGNLKYFIHLLTNQKLEDDETYDLDEELQIAIRRAKLSDLDEIYELEKVCFHTGKGRFEKHEIEEWLENSAATFFVVESVENDLIGYGLYQEFDEDAPDAEIHHHDDIKTAEIVCISVHPYYQKLHIGSKLLEMVHDLAVQNGCGRFLLEVGVDNLNAIRFYESKGYAEIKELENYYQKGANAFLMEARPDSIVMHRLHAKPEEDGKGGEE